MRKINVFHIIIDHLKTLENNSTGRISVVDIIIFYGVPFLLASFFIKFPFGLPEGINNSLIAVFSVFSALLFSAQIALYSIAPLEAKTSSDKLENKKLSKEFEVRKTFFRQINCNVSYLILLSCVSLIVFLCLEIAPASEKIRGAILIWIVTHFFLSLLMLIKRAHVAFSTKYE